MVGWFPPFTEVIPEPGKNDTALNIFPVYFILKRTLVTEGGIHIYSCSDRNSNLGGYLFIF